MQPKAMKSRAEKSRLSMVLANPEAQHQTPAAASVSVTQLQCRHHRSRTCPQLYPLTLFLPQASPSPLFQPLAPKSCGDFAFLMPKLFLTTKLPALRHFPLPEQHGLCQQACRALVPTLATAGQHGATAEQDGAQTIQGHLHAAPGHLQGSWTHGKSTRPLPRQACCALLCCASIGSVSASFLTAVACSPVCITRPGVEIKRAHLCFRGKPGLTPTPSFLPAEAGIS